jgi:hypothetical protein
MIEEYARTTATPTSSGSGSTALPVPDTQVGIGGTGSPLWSTGGWLLRITHAVRRAPCRRRAAQQIAVQMIQDELPAPAIIQYDALVANRMGLQRYAARGGANVRPRSIPVPIVA